jgi:probable phosphoglycerate mutase
MTRAMQTVRPVSDALGLPVHTDARLRELDFGKAEGHTLDEMRAQEPRAVEEFLRDPAEHHWPGGEHPTAAADRATAALLEIAAAGLGEHIMIVCHNTLIRLVICRFLGVPLSAYRGVLRGVAPVASTQLTMQEGGAVMLDHYNQPPTLAVEELDVDAL